MILHLIDTAGMYGAENVILTLLHELQSNNINVILGCIREDENNIPELAKKAKELNISVVYFTMRRGFNPIGIYRIHSFILKHNISLVHSHGYKPNIYLSAILFKNYKTITTIHGWAKRTAGIKTVFYEYLDLLSLKRLNHVVAVSKTLFYEIINKGINKSNVTVIYNGIDYKKNIIHLEKNYLRLKYNYAEDDFIIGAIGRLTKIKNHLCLIESLPAILKEINECKIIIAGDGPLKKELISKINSYHLSKNVYLVGYTDKIHEILSLIDLFVMPSLSEGLPIALLEAMASGLPVIATKVGGIPEVIDKDDCGILIPPNDAKQISDNVIKLFQDEEKRTRIGLVAKSIVQTKFSSKNMAHQYIDLYKKLI